MLFYVAADIYDDVYERVQKKGLDTECVGGGRIIHKPETKTLTVFGYSQVHNSLMNRTRIICMITSPVSSSPMSPLQ